MIANDHNHYAWMLARCYVAADLEGVETQALGLIREFNGLKGRPGYFAETFCEKSRFFKPKNGARVDAIRDAIAAKDFGNCTRGRKRNLRDQQSHILHLNKCDQ